MIAMAESESLLETIAPDVDYSLAGPWTHIEPGATRKASFVRSMAINIPLRVIHTRQQKSCGMLLYGPDRVIWAFKPLLTHPAASPEAGKLSKMLNPAVYRL